MASFTIWRQLQSKIKHTRVGVGVSVSVLFETRYQQQFKK